MQIVSEDYVDLERNFMRLMELNSVFTRHHLYLMCMDNASVQTFASLGIRCVPLDLLPFDSIHDVWKTRIRALSCLVMEGYNDSSCLKKLLAAARYLRLFLPQESIG